MATSRDNTSLHIAPDGLGLLGEQNVAKMIWDKGGYHIVFEFRAIKKDTTWIVNIVISDKALLSPSKFMKEYSLQREQHVIIGFYDNDTYQYPYNFYVDLATLLPAPHKDFSPKNESLCTLVCVENGVLITSHWQPLLIR